MIEIKETERGDVAFQMNTYGAETATRKEMCYAVNIKDLMKLEMPRLCKALGGKGAIIRTVPFEAWYAKLVALAKTKGVEWMISKNLSCPADSFKDGLTPEECVEVMRHINHGRESR